MSGQVTSAKWGSNWTEIELVAFRSVARANAIESQGSLGLLPTLLSTSWSMRSRGWWRCAPFLPLPNRQYLSWRTHTAYGDDRRPAFSDIATFARWQRGVKRLTDQESLADQQSLADQESLTGQR